tara:strand:+ start:14559 stop:15494 length:936 start_codon:yes stop_codon:yes gene_type:complete
MQVLIVGNGNHANKKIIPALKGLRYLNSIIVADRKSDNYSIKSKKKVNVINKEFLLSSDHGYRFDSVIISTYPSSHIENLVAFKDIGESFIVEKPISSDIKYLLSKEFKNLFKNTNAIESLMFFHHPLFNFLNNIIEKNMFNTLEASFTIPAIKDKDDFRYNKKLGGSAILDNGIYPISLISAVANENLKLDFKEISYHNKYGIDKNGKAQYSSKYFKKIKIKWGMTGKYSNYIKLINSKDEIFIPFFFSKPANIFPKIYFSSGEVRSVRNINHFRSLYNSFLKEEKEKFSYSTYNSIKNRYLLINELLND